MPLFLAHTWNQALLAAVIEEAGTVAKEQDSYVGRTALQKVMYFLKVAGVPMGYRFEIHNFGPFCDSILSDAEVLLADDVIVDRSSNIKKYSNYAPGNSSPELIEMHGAEIEKCRPQIRNVVQKLVPLKPDHLELLATLDFAYRWIKASGTPGPFHDRVVDRFVEIKKNKFPRSVVEQTYRSMVEANLFEA